MTEADFGLYGYRNGTMERIVRGAGVMDILAGEAS